MSDGTTAAARMLLGLGNGRNAPLNWLPMRKLDAWFAPRRFAGFV